MRGKGFIRARIELAGDVDDVIGDQFADFVAQGTKMGELYSNLAKACFKPIELTMSNMQGTK